MHRIVVQFAFMEKSSNLCSVIHAESPCVCQTLRTVSVLRAAAVRSLFSYDEY